MTKLFDKIIDIRPWEIPYLDSSDKGSDRAGRRGRREAGIMGNPKTPRHAGRVHKLKILEKTTNSVTQRRLPSRTSRNLRHYPFLKGGRTIARLGKQSGEDRTAIMQRTLEENRYGRANAIHHALKHVKTLLGEAHGREERLKLTTDELEMTTDYLQTLMGSMVDIMIVTDPEGRITEANKAAQRISGYDQGELVGKSIGTFFADPESADTGIRQVMAEKRVSDYELTLVHRGGGRIPIIYNATTLEDSDGRITGVLINARDMSELKRAQEARERYAQELARANEDLEQFASVASHDLQEPLKKVTSHARDLAERYADDFDPQAKGELEFMVSQTNQMVELIKGVLTYSRVDAAEESFAPTDCETVLDQALANLRGAIDETGAEIIHDPLPTVSGFASQLLRVFQNLIGNAIKYCDPGKERPRVHVSAERIEKSEIRHTAGGQARNLKSLRGVGPSGPEAEIESGWLFLVNDNGIGIDHDFVDDIFKMFVRLHPASEYEGAGMGLAITWKVIKRHGGEIWVESEPDKGSTFCFTIPDREAES